MSAMRCKFVLQSISRQNGYIYRDGKNERGETQNLRFSAVCDGSEENKKFFAATPSGQLEFNTVNAAAVAGLQLGGEYYIDVTPAS